MDNNSNLLAASQLTATLQHNLTLWASTKELEITTRLALLSLDPSTSSEIVRATAAQLEPYRQIKQLVSSHQEYGRIIARLPGARY